MLLLITLFLTGFFCLVMGIWTSSEGFTDCLVKSIFIILCIMNMICFYQQVLSFQF